MRAVYLVARHEFVETVKSKFFVLSLILIPLLLGVGLAIPQWLERTTTVTRNVLVVDGAGAYGAAIARELDRAWAQDALATVNAHVRAYAYDAFKTREGLDSDQVPLLFLKRSGDITDADADRFLDNGGLEWAMTVALPFLKPGTPPPVLPPRPARTVPLPDGLDAAGVLADPAATLRPYLSGEQSVRVAGAKEALHAAVLVPPAVAPAAPDSLAALGRGDPVDSVQIWSDGALPQSLAGLLPRVIDEVFREEAMMAVAGDPAVLEAARAQAPLVELDVSAAAGRQVTSADIVARFLPRILSVVLIYFLVINMQMLMTNTMEEKSSRIIEVLISSVPPKQLMIGKLLGSSLVALTMFFFTAAVLAGLVSVFGGAGGTEIARLLLGLVADSPIVPALLAYFILGYFLFAGIFLVLGALAENNKDVQSLATPITLFMFAILVIVFAYADDPDGAGARTLSLLPFFGPFMMMARVAAAPPLVEVLSSVAVQLATIALVLWLSGKVFRVAVLTNGRPPGLGRLLRMIRQEG